MFYNTTKETGNVLERYRTEATNQDERILVLIKEDGRAFFTASSIHKLYNKVYQGNTPLTSIRRSLNTLESKNNVAKIGRKKIGPYGRPENEYRLIEVY